MIRFVRKHWILCIFLTPFIYFGLSFIVQLLLIIIHSADDLYYIDIAKPNTIQFEYKIPENAYRKRCMFLEFDYDNLKQKFPSSYLKLFPVKRYWEMDNEEFFSHTENNPLLIVRIYQADKLVFNQDVYMISEHSNHSVYFLKGKLERRLLAIQGYFNTKSTACYEFLSDIPYTIEVTNKLPLPQFQQVEAFISLQGRRPKY